MNRTRSWLPVALLAALLLLLGNLALRPASAAQATQTPATVDQSDSSAANSKKKKPGAAADAPPATPAPASSSAPGSSAAPAKPPAPVAKPSASQAAQQTPPANSNGMVWVNTESRIYHKPGSRYYGKTKQGKYMTEADAIKAGYRPSEKH
jgi:hypothetical protein